MGEHVSLFRPEFNGGIQIEARPERLSGQTGAIVLREVDEKIGLSRHLAARLRDSRTPWRITHPLIELVRSSLQMMALGWRDADDADALRHDPVLRLSVSSRRGALPLFERSATERERDHNPCEPDGLASQPTLSRLTSMLAPQKNRDALREALCWSAGRHIRAMNGGRKVKHLVIDVDAVPIEVHGQQIGADYNGHLHQRMYHPVVAVSAEYGALLGVRLRCGSAHSAEGALGFVADVVRRAERDVCETASVRFDAGFPEDKLLSLLESRGTHYVARIRNNARLDRLAREHLRRPRGRPPATPRVWFYEIPYKAKSWSRPRRAILVVLEKPGELLLHHFWLLTSWTAEERPAAGLLEMYRERGTAEGHQGELKDVFDPALSSTTRPKSHYRGAEPKRRATPVEAFEVNEVRLLLNCLAYNLMNAARDVLCRTTRDAWSLRRLRERVLRVAARVLVHARYVTVVISESVASVWSKLCHGLRLLELPDSG